MTNIEKIPSRMKVTKCLYSKGHKINVKCIACSDKDCCLTVRPELASIVEKSKKQDGTYEVSSSDFSIIQAKYLRAIESDYDKLCRAWTYGWSNRIRVTECLSSKVVEKDETCETCRDKGCCLTINPELASIEKRKKPDGTCDFTKADLDLIQTKYPRSLTMDYEQTYPAADSMGMRMYLLDAYSGTKAMHHIVSREVISKLKMNRYTDEEIKFLYIAITTVFDQVQELYYERTIF